jgi:hypothetical protein
MSQFYKSSRASWRSLYYLLKLIVVLNFITLLQYGFVRAANFPQPGYPAYGAITTCLTDKSLGYLHSPGQRSREPVKIAGK